MCRSAARALLGLAAGAALSAGASAAPLPGASDAPGGVMPPTVATLVVAPDTTGGRLESEPSAAGRPIRSITIVAHNIYDPVPPGRLAPLYRAANRFHLITRPATVRHHLAFAAGERWDDERGRETLRTLRGLSYLEPVVLRAATGDDSADVVLTTRDVWSTIAEFNLERGGGQSYGAVALTERNLLGFGKWAALAYRRDPTGISRSIAWYDPAVAGSRVRLQIAAGTGSAGVTNQVYAGVPFWSQDAPYTAFASWSRTTSQGRLFDRGAIGAEFDQRRVEGEAAWGRGGRVGGTVRRLVYSFYLRDRTLGPSRLQPGATLDFAGGEEQQRIRRLAAELVLWRPRYIERRGVDRMTGIEDFDVGPLASVKLGFSPHLLGSTTDESYTRFALGAGAETPLGFGTVHAAMATRFRFTAEELIRGVEARWVSQRLPRQTLVAAGWGSWGMRMARDWQQVVGGLNGLRAYPVHALAGRQVWRFNTEDRWLIGRDYWHLVDVGLAGFWDAGRAWGTGAAGTDWHHDAGVGLRLALPHLSSSQLIRIDVAWPLSPAPAGRREAVFSFGSNQAF